MSASRGRWNVPIRGGSGRRAHDGHEEKHVDLEFTLIVALWAYGIQFLASFVMPGADGMIAFVNPVL